MNLKAILLSVFAPLIMASVAQAELSTSTRLADCLEVRGPAYAMSLWRKAPCQADSSCEPFDEAQYTQVPAYSCSEEALNICATKQGDEQDQCVSEGLIFLREKIKGFNLDALQKDLAQAAQDSTGFQKRSAERRVNDLNAISEPYCPEDLAASYPWSILAEEEYCAWLDLTADLSKLMYLRANAPTLADQ